LSQLYQLSLLHNVIQWDSCPHHSKETILTIVTNILYLNLMSYKFKSLSLLEVLVAFSQITTFSLKHLFLYFLRHHTLFVHSYSASRENVTMLQNWSSTFCPTFGNLSWPWFKCYVNMMTPKRVSPPQSLISSPDPWDQQPSCLVNAEQELKHHIAYLLPICMLLFHLPSIPHISNPFYRFFYHNGLESHYIVAHPQPWPLTNPVQAPSYGEYFPKSSDNFSCHY
jgi:hypothetical protein